MGIILFCVGYFSNRPSPHRYNADICVSRNTSLLALKLESHLSDDCPEDLYILEGDVDAFDDSSFNADELEGAVCVQLNDRQMPFSCQRFQPISRLCGSVPYHPK